MLLLPLLFSFAVPQTGVLDDPSLATSVTFTSRAAGAKAVLDALAKASGKSIAAAGNMQSDILIVDVRAVPLRETMHRLADATGATWVKENGVFYLSRTDADEQRRMNDQRQIELQALNKTIVECKQRLAVARPFDSAAARALTTKYAAETTKAKEGSGVYDYRTIQVLQAQEPSGKLSDAIFSQLDPAQIVATPPFRRTVLSTIPTQTERPLKLDAAEAVATFVREQNIFAEAQAAKGNDATSLPAYSHGGKIDQPIAKIDVCVDRSDDYSSGLRIEIVLVGADGQAVERVDRSLQLYKEPTDFNAFAPKPNEAKLTISDDERAEINLLASAMGQPAKPVPLSAEAKSRLFKPVENEPLATYVSSLFMEAAESRGLNLVADVPDVYIMLGPAACMVGAPSAGSWLRMTQSLPGEIGTAKIDDKWIEIDGGAAWPTSPLTVRCNRQDLTDMLQSGDEHGIPIQALARYAYGTGRPSFDFLSLVMAIMRSPAANVEGPDKWNALRFFGALQLTEGDAAFKDRKCAVSGLPRAAQDILADIVFTQKPQVMWSWHRGQVSRQYVTQGELSDLLPNGLPPNGQVSIWTVKNDVAYAETGHGEALTAATIASDTYRKDHPNPNWPAEGHTTSEKYRFGSSSEHILTVELTPNATLRLEYEDKYMPGGPAVPFDQLPAGFVSEVRNAIKQFGG